MTVFNLTLAGALHLGEFTGIDREATLDWVPSDSLFAALMVTYASLGGSVGSYLEQFLTGTPPFVISSAFPRAGEVRFYPAPPYLPGHSGMFNSGKFSKQAKKLRWISEEVLGKLVAGATPEIETENFLHAGSLWLSKAERRQVNPYMTIGEDGQACLWQSQIVPRVTVDRSSNAATLFHSGRITFNRECGLWFAVRGNPELVRMALPHLGESGLGGLRSTGHGGFSWDERSLELPDAENRGLLLSRYAPRSVEEIRIGLKDPHSAYRLVSVGGWCQDERGKSWRRRAVRLLAEGALLPAGLQGKLVDVRPEPKPAGWSGNWHAVYRYGLAFLIPAGRLVEDE